MVLPADLGEVLRPWCRTAPCARGRRRRTSTAPAASRTRRSRRAPACGASSAARGRRRSRSSEPGCIFSKPSASAQSALTAADRLGGEVERGRAGRAVVVDVDDRDAGHAELVDRALARGRLAVHVADVGLLDSLVGDARRPRAPWCPPPWPSPGSPSSRVRPGFSNFVMPTPTTYTFSGTAAPLGGRAARKRATARPTDDNCPQIYM